jgi:hypothetical protein
VADERGLVHARIAHHRQNGAREEIRRVGGVRLVALAVAGKVNEDQPRLVREGRDLLAPEAEIARPAVDENNCLPALAHRDVMDLVRAEGNKMRLPVSQRFGFRRGGAAGECKQDGGPAGETNNFNHAQESLSNND